MTSTWHGPYPHSFSRISECHFIWANNSNPFNQLDRFHLHWIFHRLQELCAHSPLRASFLGSRMAHGNGTPESTEMVICRILKEIKTSSEKVSTRRSIGKYMHTLTELCTFFRIGIFNFVSSSFTFSQSPNFHDSIPWSIESIHCSTWCRFFSVTTWHSSSLQNTPQPHWWFSAARRACRLSHRTKLFSQDSKAKATVPKATASSSQRCLALQPHPWVVKKPWVNTSRVGGKHLKNKKTEIWNYTI